MRIYRKLLLFLIVLTLGAVAYFVIRADLPADLDEQKLITQHRPLRAGSLGFWLDLQVNDQDSIDYLLAHSSLVWDNTTKLDLQPVRLWRPGDEVVGARAGWV